MLERYPRRVRGAANRIIGVPGALPVALAALLMAGCGPGGGPPQGGGGFPPAPVTLETVAVATVPLRREFVGQAAGSKEAEVRARVEGILERRAYREGARVAAGQTLFVIDPRPYAVRVEQAAAALAQAQAQAGQARRHLDRLRPLVGERAISQREFDDAVAADESAAAAVRQAQAQLAEARLHLSYTTVSAPVAGVASRALKSEGSLVSPGADSLLTTVSQVDPVHINFTIAESEQLQFDRQRTDGRVVTPAEGLAGYAVTVVLADGKPYPRKGRLVFIDPRINAATGSFDARAEVPNPDGALHPGQFLRVVIEGAERRDAIAIPQRAVMEGPQGKFVYVAEKAEDGREVAAPRPVQVSSWVELAGGRRWIVDAGLAAGDRLIVEGMAKIFPVPGGAPIVVAPPGGGAPPGAAAEPAAK